MHVMHVSLTRKSSQRVEYSDGHEVLQTDEDEEAYLIKKLQLLHDVLRYDTNVAYFHMIVGCVRTFYVPPYSSYTYTHIFMVDSTYLIFAQFLAFGPKPLLMRYFVPTQLNLSTSKF